MRHVSSAQGQVRMSALSAEHTTSRWATSVSHALMGIVAVEDLRSARSCATSLVLIVMVWVPTTARVAQMVVGSTPLISHAKCARERAMGWEE
jgi:hypothetical protein